MKGKYRNRKNNNSQNYTYNLLAEDTDATYDDCDIESADGFENSTEIYSQVEMVDESEAVMINEPPDEMVYPELAELNSKESSNELIYEDISESDVIDNIEDFGREPNEAKDTESYGMDEGSVDDNVSDVSKYEDLPPEVLEILEAPTVAPKQEVAPDERLALKQQYYDALLRKKEEEQLIDSPFTNPEETDSNWEKNIVYEKQEFKNPQFEETAWLTSKAEDEYERKFQTPSTKDESWFSSFKEEEYGFQMPDPNEKVWYSKNLEEKRQFANPKADNDRVWYSEDLNQPIDDYIKNEQNEVFSFDKTFDYTGSTNNNIDQTKIVNNGQNSSSLTNITSIKEVQTIKETHNTKEFETIRYDDNGYPIVDDKDIAFLTLDDAVSSMEDKVEKFNNNLDGSEEKKNEIFESDDSDSSCFASDDVEEQTSEVDILLKEMGLYRDKDGNVHTINETEDNRQDDKNDEDQHSVVHVLNANGRSDSEKGDKSDSEKDSTDNNKNSSEHFLNNVGKKDIDDLDETSNDSIYGSQNAKEEKDSSDFAKDGNESKDSSLNANESSKDSNETAKDNDSSSNYAFLDSDKDSGDDNNSYNDGNDNKSQNYTSKDLNDNQNEKSNNNREEQNNSNLLEQNDMDKQIEKTVNSGKSLSDEQLNKILEDMGVPFEANDNNKNDASNNAESPMIDDANKNNNSSAQPVEKNINNNFDANRKNYSKVDSVPIVAPIPTLNNSGDNGNKNFVGGFASSANGNNANNSDKDKNKPVYRDNNNKTIKLFIDDGQITCKVCGHLNKRGTGICEMCSNYLEEK